MISPPKLRWRNILSAVKLKALLVRGWTRVNDAVRAALESVSLAEMAGTAPLSLPPREVVTEPLPEHAAGLLATA